MPSLSKSTERRIAGLFLWLHIAVSYAINSQAICISIMNNILWKNKEEYGNSNNNNNNKSITTTAKQQQPLLVELVLIQ